jgi:hypothetical protein
MWATSKGQNPIWLAARFPSRVGEQGGSMETSMRRPRFSFFFFFWCGGKDCVKRAKG